MQPNWIEGADSPSSQLIQSEEDGRKILEEFEQNFIFKAICFFQANKNSVKTFKQSILILLSYYYYFQYLKKE